MSTPTASPRIHLLLLSAEPELPEWMLEDIGAQPTEDGGHEVSVLGHQIHIVPHHSGKALDPNLNPQLLIGLVRFVDVLSLQKLDELYHTFSSKHGVPAGFLVYRNENESDFKMSCPFCGQKIWVRDADLDKRGRCPGCKKGFTLPNQEAHVAAALRLAEGVPVRRVMRSDPASLSGSLQALLRLHKSSALQPASV